MKKHLILFLLCCLVGLSSCIKQQADPYIDANAQLAKDEVIIKKFIADSAITALRHETGLYYQIIKPGSGSHSYTANSNVTVKYKGKFLAGSVFDESKPTATFPLGQVITGWQIGMQLIQKGGKIRLLIPSGYAYGPQGRGSIPPNAILDFDIELIDVQ